jgi:hypothetical protein
VTLNMVLEGLRARAVEFKKLSVTLDGAALLQEVIGQLESCANDYSRVCSISEAAKLSGYSEDHLRLLVRLGKIPNAGRKHAPRIRECDLPRRPYRQISQEQSVQYDPITDAQSLKARR